MVVALIQQTWNFLSYTHQAGPGTLWSIYCTLKTSAGPSFRWVLMSTKVTVPVCIYLFWYTHMPFVTSGLSYGHRNQGKLLFNGGIFRPNPLPPEKSHCAAFQKRWCFPHQWLSLASMMRSSIGLILQLHSYLLTSLNYFLLCWTHHFRPLNFPEAALPIKPKASSADKHSIRTTLGCWA